MKKFLLCFALAMFSFANAQKGTVLVSGNVNYTSEKNSNDTFTAYQNFGFSPKVGYQFTDNWTLGVESTFNQNKWENNFSNNQKVNYFSIGTFARYSKPLNDSFSFFTDLGIGFQNRKEFFSDSSSTESINKAQGFYANLQPKIFLKIKNNFGINFGLGGLTYSSFNNQDSNNTVNSFNVNFGQAYTVGIQKNF